MGTKPRNSTRARKARASRSTERPAYRKARDERIALQLLGVKAAVTMVRDGRPDDKMLQVHIERHILVPLAACICFLSPDSSLNESRRARGAR